MFSFYFTLGTPPPFYLFSSLTLTRPRLTPLWPPPSTHFWSMISLCWNPCRELKTAMSPENSNSCYSQSQISCQPTFLPHPDPELCPPTHESGFDSAYHRRVNPSLGSDYSWPFHILAPGVSSCSQQQQLLPVSLPLQSNTSLPLSTEVPLTASDFEIALSVKRLGTKHAGNSGHQGKPVPDESTTRSVSPTMDRTKWSNSLNGCISVNVDAWECH